MYYCKMIPTKVQVLANIIKVILIKSNLPTITAFKFNKMVHIYISCDKRLFFRPWMSI